MKGLPMLTGSRRLSAPLALTGLENDSTMRCATQRSWLGLTKPNARSLRYSHLPHTRRQKPSLLRLAEANPLQQKHVEASSAVPVDVRFGHTSLFPIADTHDVRRKLKRKPWLLHCGVELQRSCHSRLGRRSCWVASRVAKVVSKGTLMFLLRQEYSEYGWLNAILFFCSTQCTLLLQRAG